VLYGSAARAAGGAPALLQQSGAGPGVAGGWAGLSELRQQRGLGALARVLGSRLRRAQAEVRCRRLRVGGSHVTGTTTTGTARGQVSICRAMHLVYGVLTTAAHKKLAWSLAGHATSTCGLHLLQLNDHSQLWLISGCHVHDRKVLQAQHQPLKWKTAPDNGSRYSQSGCSQQHVRKPGGSAVRSCALHT